MFVGRSLLGTHNSLRTWAGPKLYGFTKAQHKVGVEEIKTAPAAPIGPSRFESLLGVIFRGARCVSQKCIEMCIPKTRLGLARSGMCPALGPLAYRSMAGTRYKIQAARYDTELLSTYLTPHQTLQYTKRSISVLIQL